MNADLKRESREAEAHGDLQRAIKAYEEDVKKGSPDPFAYERLLVLYRKSKKFKEELRVLKKGITLFSAQFKKEQEQRLTGKKGKQLERLSKALAKKTGLLDTKGNSIYLPGPLHKWIQRIEIVEGKLKNFRVS